MTYDQAQQLLAAQEVASQYAQEVASSSAQINASAQFEAHVAMYLLGVVILAGLLIAALLRPRNRGV